MNPWLLAGIVFVVVGLVNKASEEKEDEARRAQKRAKKRARAATTPEPTVIESTVTQPTPAANAQPIGEVPSNLQE